MVIFPTELTTVHGRLLWAIWPMRPNERADRDQGPNGSTLAQNRRPARHGRQLGRVDRGQRRSVR
jgi:hypothetical protein